MKYKPGYREVNLLGKAITAGGLVPVNVPGVWDAIESSPRAILITGLVLDTEEYKPFFATCFLDASKYHIHVKTEVTDGELVDYTLEIDDDDGILCLKATVTGAETVPGAE